MRILLVTVLTVLFESCACISKSVHSEAIQIIKTKEGPGGTRVLHYNGDPTLKDILTADDVKDLPILVYSVTGKTRGGKSFLLDLMYKYLDHEGRSNWTAGPVPKVFDFQDGIDSWTKGLWVCTKVFKRTLKDGSRVGIMLMDNQGLFDGVVTSGESVAMSGVSTILSHVQMFNMKEKITTNDLEQIMLHLVPDNSTFYNSTFYNSTEKTGNHSTIGSSLMFVVRDFMGKKKYGYGLTNGSKYIEDDQKRGTKEYQSMWADQRSIFNKIDCVLLPHPGLNVTTEEFTDSPVLGDLEKEFVSQVNTLLQEIFAPENLIPQTAGLNGFKMYDTLKNIDGKVADKSLSYYNMFMDRTNNLMVETAVALFTSKLEASNDIYKANGYMEEILNTTEFKGQSAAGFTTKLKGILAEITNRKVKTHVFEMYNLALIGKGIISLHKDIWSKVISALRLLVGSEPEVQTNKEDIIRDVATVYYSKLVLQESNKFKDYCETASPQQFYEKLVALNSSQRLNALLESAIKTCDDFEKIDVSPSMLKDIRNKQQHQFGLNVKGTILRKMYKIKNYFVQKYKDRLVRQNVAAENKMLWPGYKREIDNLEFGSISERHQIINAITEEIASIYYRALRKEAYGTLKSYVTALSDGDFRDMAKDDNKIESMVSEQFLEYSMFREDGLTHIWMSEKEILYRDVLLELYKGLNKRRNEKEALTFWQKFWMYLIKAFTVIDYDPVE